MKKDYLTKKTTIKKMKILNPKIVKTNKTIYIYIYKTKNNKLKNLPQNPGDTIVAPWIMSTEPELFLSLGTQ